MGKMKVYSGITKCLLLTVVVPAVLWTLSFGKTYTLYRQNRHVVVMGQGLESEEKQIKKYNSAQQVEAFLSSGKILDTIASYISSQKVTITHYAPYLSGSEGGINLYTSTLVLEGGYTELVLAINAIEQSSLPVKIISAEFKVRKKLKEKKESLFLTLVFQQLETVSLVSN